MEEVYLVWRRERHEHAQMVCVCSTIEVAKARADAAARRWDFALGEWISRSNGQSWYLTADVRKAPAKDWQELTREELLKLLADSNGDDDDRIAYTIETEKVFTMPEPDRNPKSRYGVICPTHGEQGLDYKEYMTQLARPDSLWQCPICREAADWDDCRYEAKER